MTDVLITAGELAEFLKKEPCVVIDTRNPEAYGAGHLAGAVNRPAGPVVPAAASIRERHFALPFAVAGSRQRMRHTNAELLACVARQKCAQLRAQHFVAPFSEKTAIRLVDERECEVRRETAHQFGLAVDHGAISLFALA